MPSLYAHTWRIGDAKQALYKRQAALYKRQAALYKRQEALDKRQEALDGRQVALYKTKKRVSHIATAFPDEPHTVWLDHKHRVA